jgi:hypothetical protein
MGGGVEATWQRNSLKLIKIGKSEERQALGLYDVRRMNDARLIDIMYFTFKTAVTLSVTKEGLELPDDDEETKKRESDKAKFDALAW